MLKVLVIGCGNIAGGFDANIKAGAMPRTHAGAYAAQGQFSIQTCVEPDADKRVAFMARWGIPKGYESVEQLSAATVDAGSSSQFDVISVCSPTQLHHEHVVQALRLSPKLIFCEKPICNDLTQAQDLVQRCNDHGVKLAVNHNRRWDLNVRVLRDQLKAGQWGQIRTVMGQYNKGVLNNGSHLIDLLQDLMGPLAVMDCGKPCFDYSISDPSVPAVLVSEDGVHITLSCGHAGDYSLFELQFVTQRGVIAMEDGGLTWRTRLAAPSQQFSGYHELSQSQFTAGSYLQTMANAVENIYRAVTDGDALASDGESALRAQLVCQQMLHQSTQPSAR